MYEYFIELLGVITIVYAKLLTEADPLIMGLVYFSMFTIGKGITKGYFTPFAPFVLYGLGRMPLMESIKLLMIQFVGAGLVVLTFIPIQKVLKTDF